HRRRRAREGLLLLERDGQPGVDGWLRQPLRARVREFRDAEAHAEDERPVVPRGRTAERGGVAQRGGSRGLFRVSFSPTLRTGLIVTGWLILALVVGATGLLSRVPLELRLRGELEDVKRKLAIFEEKGHADVLK